MGFRAQIPHTAVPRCPRHQVPVQKLPVLFQHFQPHAAVALAQVLEHHQKGSPDRFFAQGLAHRGGMGQNDVLLELGRFVLVNGLGAQGPEARGHPVHNLFLFHPLLHQGPGLVDPSLIGFTESYLRLVPDHCQEVLQINFTAQFNCPCHTLTFLPQHFPPRYFLPGFHCPQCPFWFPCP